MRKKFVALMVGALALGISGCTAAPSPLQGLFYTDIRFPSYYDGVEATGPGLKRGQAQSSSVLGLVATGDSSVEAACKAGGIRKIATIDQHSTSILGLYATYTTIVTGE